MSDAVIIAAGAGRRLGGVAKALLRTGSTTYLGRIVENARAAGAERIVVVVGAPHAAAVREEALRLGIAAADVVENPAPERGMATSIELGFRAMHGSRAAYLWPVDHPFVTLRTLALVERALGPYEVARPTYGGRGGHPPLVAAAVFDRLATCSTAPEGARSVIANADVIDVLVDDPGVVHDIDTPEDLA